MENETPVSLGYDRVRFLKAVFLNDTITVTYRIAAIDEARRRSIADIVAWKTRLRFRSATTACAS